MAYEHLSDAEIDSWFKTLGITTKCQWDVLIFLYRHQTSLVGADFIARLLGYATGPSVAALEVLEGLGLVVCSRVSQIVRLYQFTAPLHPPQRDAWAGLLGLASDRTGRLRLFSRLRNGDQTPQERLQAAQRILAESQRSLQAIRQHAQAVKQRAQLRRGRGQPWLKAS